MIRCCAFVTLLVAAVARAEPPATVARTLARELTDGRYDAAFARFAEPLRRQFPRAELERVMEPRRARAPARVSLLRRRAASDGTTLTMRARWSTGTPSEIEATVGSDGRVVHLSIWDDDDPIYAYQTRARLRPPFSGTWTVAFVAPDDSSSRAADPRLRFALDWVIRDDADRTFRGDGKRNADYFAFGREVLAPAAARVALVVDGQPDHAPGAGADASDLPGNRVVLDLGRGEFAILMHLQSGSIKVRLGQRVVAGQSIARVGDSGRCREPNLQFVLADRPRLEDGKSLPVTFRRVLLDGEQAERAMPIYGTRLAPAEHWDPNGPMHEEDED